MEAPSIVLLRLEEDVVRVYFGSLREVTSKRIKVWFGHTGFGQKVWSFDAKGFPTADNRDFLGDCRLVAREEFDQISRFIDAMTAVTGGHVLTATVTANPGPPATLYRFV